MPEPKVSEIPIKEEIAGVFDVMADRLPKLIVALKETLFSEEAGREIGRAVGGFYKEILASGLDPDMAADLTRTYMSTLSNVVKRETTGATSTIKIERGKSESKDET